MKRRRPMASHRAPFNWADPLLLDAQLSDTERMVQDSATSDIS